ncbi:hypothetical protein Peur_015085 [Populus x canadensis]
MYDWCHIKPREFKLRVGHRVYNHTTTLPNEPGFVDPNLGVENPGHRAWFGCIIEAKAGVIPMGLSTGVPRTDMRWLVCVETLTTTALVSRIMKGVQVTQHNNLNIQFIVNDYTSISLPRKKQKADSWSAQHIVSRSQNQVYPAMNNILLELSPHSFALSIKLVKPFVVIMYWIPFFWVLKQGLNTSD